MFGILVSALYTVLGFLVRSALVKFVVFFALFYITTELMTVVIPLLPNASSMLNAFSMQAPGVWYFLDIFKVGFGISISLSAFVTRFIIRRIPLIG